MTAVISVPGALADTLPGRRITPFGAAQTGRAYAIAEVVNPPPLALAIVIYRDDDSRTVRYFKSDRDAVMWATLDALTRGLASWKQEDR